MNPDSHSSSSSPPPAPCKFCDSTEDFLGQPGDLHLLFHGDCQQCRPSAALEPILCSFCRHLRLQHLHECTPALFQRPTCFTQTHTYSDEECSLCPHCKNTAALSAACHLDGGSLADFDIRFDFTLLYEQPTIEVSTPHVQFTLRPNHASAIQSTVQWGPIKSWLHDCSSNHEGCCESVTDLPADMLIIDVQRRRVQSVDRDCRFVALSYVWGSVPAGLSLSSSTASRLLTDGGLDPHDTPATIEDAIHVCLAIGERYLWVDRLCINQDDGEHVESQINRMHKIYSSAYLVIIATHGTISSGIPGVRQPRSPEICERQDNPGVPDPEQMLERSPWMSRGWTYQEAVFARRKLFLTPVREFLVCNNQSRRLLPNVQVDNPARLALGYNPFSLGLESESQLETWAYHLAQYSHRKLSHSSDVYNALAGISNAIYPAKGSMLFGLPRQDFERALLWCVNPYDLVRRHSQCKHRTLEEGGDQVELPSWSWSSVSSPVYLSDRAGDPHASLLCWQYQHESPDEPGLLQWLDVWNEPEEHYGTVAQQGYVQEAEEPGYEPEDGMASEAKWRKRLSTFQLHTYFAMAWSNGCVEARYPFPPVEESVFTSLNAKLTAQYPSSRGLLKQVLLEYGSFTFSLPRAVQDNEACLEEMGSEIRLPRSTIKSRGQTAHFSLATRPVVRSDKESSFVCITDNTGAPVGRIWSNGLTWNAEIQPFLGDQNHPFEFLALSVGASGESDQDRDVLIHGEQSLPFTVGPHYHRRVVEFNGLLDLWEDRIPPKGEARGANTNIFDSELNWLETPVVRVMLIGKRGPLSYRVSIGWIYLSSWVRVEREFKTIYLI